MTSSLLPPEGVSAAAWSLLARADGSRWAIVERNATGEVIGTAYRDADGRKDFAADGKRGLIMPWPLATYAGSSESAPVYVAEGASDTAALLGLGLDAVGVPMAGHGGEILAVVLANRHVVIVADADKAGRRGAAKISTALLGRCASVRIIEPPEDAKDARAAVIAGANAAAFQSLTAAATPMSLVEAHKPVHGAPMIVRLSDVTPEQVAWLWPGRIALGKLTLIAGDPGLGKSFLTLDMAARVSRGSGWPDAPSVTTPGGVVLLSAEDGVADTIRPRLDAADADVKRIVALAAIRGVSDNGRESTRTFDLSRICPALECAIQAVEDCRLVIIDPVTAYVGGQTDSHNNTDIRGLLAPLAALAAKYGVAIVLVTHLNKSAGGPAIYRAMGSLAFTAAARSAWSVSKDGADPSRRLLLPIKNNIAPDTGGLAYTIQPKPGHTQPIVAWELDPVSVSADDALATDHGESGGRNELKDAVEWLRDLLILGPRAARDVERDARDAGHSIATVRRAKAAIGVVSRKPAFGGPWEWILPAQVAQPPKMLTEEPRPPTREHLGEKQAEVDGTPPKMLNLEGVSALDEGESHGNTPTNASDGRRAM